MRRTRLERKTPLQRMRAARLPSQEASAEDRELLSKAPEVSGKPRRSTRLRPKKRSAATFARVYGSTARVLWVKSLPCVVCGGGPCEGHHITNGGMGRKADAHQIVPLCRDHHALAHQHGDASWQEYYHGLDLTTEAARVEAAWQERCGLEPIGRVVARVLPTLTGEDA